LAALANPKRRIHRLLATKDAAAGLPAGLARKPQIVEGGQISAVLPREAVHQGLAALVEPLAGRNLAEFCAPESAGLLLALDQVTDPHNVGAILRSAAAFGVAGVILTERHAPGATGALAKAASGALEYVPLIRVVNLAQTLSTLKDADYTVIGLAEEGETALPALPPSERMVLVLGAEGTGLRRLTRERCDLLVHLPTRGPMASLNVSNAAAVALYALSVKGR
jgi:23S rRNA (guanosine2251-2'-O)-methyltransferase